MTSSLRRLVRVAAVGAAVGTLVVLGAQAAEAHVTVHADETTTGEFSQLTFRVPNESDTAGTVTLEVTLPDKTPFLFVSTKPVPGWTATTSEQALPAPVTVEGTTITKAVRTVTWQATAGTRIEPGQYQEFSLSVGPLPVPGTVLMPAKQTYSDGTVVTWDQPTPAGGPEPEHPAPAVAVVKADIPPAAQAAEPVATSTSDPLARVLAGVAVVLALLGGGLALWSSQRRRQ